MSAAAIAAAVSQGGIRPPAIKRPPLGPFPRPVDYDHVLPFTPPKNPDLYFYRGNFCGLHMPGAPVVPGGNANNPDLMMACLLDNYPAEWQAKYLDTYAGYGYTHLQRSIGHSLFYGGTVQSHIALSKQAQARGLYCDEWFLGGEALMTRDQDAAYWAPILQPIIDQMLAAGVVDTACVGWQLDQWNQPGNPLISIIAYIAAALPSRIPLYTHWVNEALAWWKTGGQVWFDPDHWPNGIDVDDRFSWWACMQPYLTGGHHQGNTTMAQNNPKLYQDKMKDTLDPFAGDTAKGDMGQSVRRGFRENFRLVGFEETAQDQFDGSCSEQIGDTIGYVLLCTTGYQNAGLSGYGNGARSIDGGWL